jgi:hypothetical protein
MNDTIPTLSLHEILDHFFAASRIDANAAASAVAAVEDIRRREYRLRRWLPAQLVRRLDRGFARSNTVHPDTAQALYAIAHALRPRIILETGTYWGYSTAILAAVARDVDAGVVHSFDLYPRAGAHIPLSLRPWVRLHRGSPATDAIPSALRGLTAELFFQDSVHDYAGVLAELRTALPLLAPDAIVLFHDFVTDDVRRAAVEGLPGYFVAQVITDDPKQLGIAVAPARVSTSGGGKDAGKMHMY